MVLSRQSEAKREKALFGLEPDRSVIGRSSAPDVLGALDLAPAEERPGPVGRVDPLRDDALEPHRAGPPEQRRAFPTLDMVGEPNHVVVLRSSYLPIIISSITTPVAAINPITTRDGHRRRDAADDDR